MWGNTRAGPYLVLDREDRVLGTTGLDVETPWRAATGYVLRRDAWGRGLASEAAVAMTRLADDLGVIRLHALCHPDNTASARVLATAGFLGKVCSAATRPGSAGRGCSRGICSGRSVRNGGQGPAG